MPTDADAKFCRKPIKTGFLEAKLHQQIAEYARITQTPLTPLPLLSVCCSAPPASCALAAAFAFACGGFEVR
jgi:hypothetical protein